MFKLSLSPEDLTRLHDEREDADRVYNEALTALDNAIQHLRDMPDAPPHYDEHQVTPLNKCWDLSELTPAETNGWRGRIRAFVWRTVAPVFDRQQMFNSALVDHINRNIEMNREVTKAVASATAMMREELERLVTFQHKLLQFAQQITAYVDTKDREVGGTLAVGLAGGLSGLSDELQKRWESMVAREQRYVARVDEIRSTTAVWHEVTASLKRELERLQTSPTPGTNVDSGTSDIATFANPSTPQTATYDSYKYVAFEDKFRGSESEIRARVAGYLPYFEGTTDVLDVGCGRGEFLELLQEHGVTATGVDLDHDMVEVCRSRGLSVHATDVLSHLATLPDASLGGLFAAQVVEHLEPAYLLKFINMSLLKLRPRAKLVLETINVASWSAFFQSYVRDITHCRPLHPDTLKYLVTASGFQQAEIIYLSSVPPENKLQFAADSSSDQEASTVISVLNHNVEMLNALLFADQDYAVVAQRG